ncbi:MAG: hypothetical protein IT260_23080 [Saprospiraceae bacterium]|nr:hypothetical protein [Saprospiraceae bacterium]
MEKQNKTVQIALVAAVVLVWALVVYRFRQMQSGQVPADSQLEYTVPPSQTADQAVDSLFVRADYPDPFFPGRTVSRAGYGATGRAAERPAARPAPAPVFVPDTRSVQYLGFSQDQKNMRRARITMGNQRFTVQEGQEVQGLKVLAVYRDSVRIFWQGTTRILLRQRDGQ